MNAGAEIPCSRFLYLPAVCASLSVFPLTLWQRFQHDSVMRWIMLVLLLCLISLQIRLWIGEGSREETVRLEREIEQQKVINERLKSRNSVLENEVRDLKSGLESVEERARSDLGLIREGETFYILADEEKK